MASTESLGAVGKAAAVLRNAASVAVPANLAPYIYNPLEYAWETHADYVHRYGEGRKRVLFLGMNPGPFGMTQTGVPFGEIAAVRDWMKIHGDIGHPSKEHPKRPIQGFDCPRSEVSGRRLWGLFQERFGEPGNFFRSHFVVNYCPLVFMDEGGKNLTPDKMSTASTAKLFAACDRHLRSVTEGTGAEWVIGVGDFALGRAREALNGVDVKFGKILHPSPASPAANRGWSAAATKQLEALGVW